MAVFSAQAEQPLYFGAQYSQQSVDDASWDFGLVSGVAGYKFNDIFAIEGRLGVGVQDEEYSGALTRVKIGIDNSYSVLGKASWPVLETLSVYGIAGFNKTKYDIKITGPALGAVGSYPVSKDTSVFVRADAIYAQIKIEEDRTSKWQPAVGVGISHHIADGFSVRGQYQYMFLKEKDLDIDAPVHNVSVGVTQTF